MNALVTVRSAVEADIEDIYQLLEFYAVQKIVLHRDREDLRFYLGNFVVAEFDGKVCGCCAVRDFGNDLLEVRSLVVSPTVQGKGIGRAMLRAIVAGLKLRRQSWRLFTLTLQPGFFRALGFQDASRLSFPEKIWADCSKCPRQDHCDETALILTDAMPFL